MDLVTYLYALLLGTIEGLTEFLPISSTGHLILAVDFLGFKGPPGKVFEVVIQLGAILAVCWAYQERLLAAAAGVFGGAESRRFVLNIVVAFLPAMVAGVLLHGFIKSVLFSPWVVAVALIAGGIAIIAIERMGKHRRFNEVDDFPAALAFKIGLCQVLAMIPGISRAGTT